MPMTKPICYVHDCIYIYIHVSLSELKFYIFSTFLLLDRVCEVCDIFGQLMLTCMYLCEGNFVEFLF